MRTRTASTPTAAPPIAAVGVEAVRVRISVEAERLGAGHARLCQPGEDIGLDVELVMAPAAGGEEALVGGVGLAEAAGEGFVHLIALAGDHRADGGGDPLAPGAVLFHRGDDRFDDAGKGAFPAGMGGADHAGLAVGEQDRRAVRREDAQDEARPVGDDRVGLGPGVVGPRRVRIERVGRMDLMDRDQGSARRHGGDGAAAIFVNGVAVVVGAEADVEARIVARRDAALAPEKAVREAGQAGGADHLDGAHSRSSRMTGSV